MYFIVLHRFVVKDYNGATNRVKILDWRSPNAYLFPMSWSCFICLLVEVMDFWVLPLNIFVSGIFIIVYTLKIVETM